MLTQVQVIRRLMESLDVTELTGISALDEAIRSSSRFDGLDNLIDRFVADCESASSAEEFLLDKCGIDLDNADTGAITGYDAGGAVIKTAETIVEESGAWNYPEGTSFEVNGLTVNVPERDTLTAAEQNVIRGLYSWWLSGALELISNSYGENYSFVTSSSATVREIDVVFLETGSFLAQVGHRYRRSTGEATALVLQINMKYYKTLTSDDFDGLSSSAGALYLDRALAHELTHAVMAANVKNFNALPGYFKEGMAELTHGVDDQRGRSIRLLASDASKLREALSDSTGTVTVSGVNAASYAAGYMLLRYLARQEAGLYVELTEDDDWYENARDGATIMGLGGDDTINNSARDVVIDAGDGNDVIIVGVPDSEIDDAEEKTAGFSDGVDEFIIDRSLLDRIMSVEPLSGVRVDDESQFELRAEKVLMSSARRRLP